ncbi:MAG: hypothetical protein ACREUE_14705 [Panacagrimonas sp.]
MNAINFLRVPLLVLAMSVPALLAGCASPAPAPGGTRTSRDSGEGMNAALASWKGRAAYDAVAMWGMPDSITREGTLGMLRWKADASAGGAKQWGQPFSGDGSEQQSAAVEPSRRSWAMRCARVLYVDIQEIVQRATWYGSDGCSTNPADYLPPP